MFVTSVVLALVGTAHTSGAQGGGGQARVGRAGGGRQPVSRVAVGSMLGPTRSGPIEQPFTARLDFVPAPTELAAPRAPLLGLPWNYVGFVPLLLWDATMSAAVLQLGAIPQPSREGWPTGGVQLDVLPRRAQVYVDGRFAGVVDDFKGYYRHLELTAGSHLIEIIERGYYPLTVTVIVSPGRTVTYRNTLGQASSGD
jgi:hypothetical protein